MVVVVVEEEEEEEEEDAEGGRVDTAHTEDTEDTATPAWDTRRRTTSPTDSTT